VNIKNIIICALAAASLYFAFSAKIKQKHLDAALAQNTVLAEGVKRQFIIERNKIIYKYRTSCGAAEVKTYFIPVEGRAEIQETPQDSAEVSIKNKGFTFKPFAAATYGSGPSFALGARLFYFNRYGLGAAVNNEGLPLLSADRRLDDILPLENTSLIFLGGYKKAYLGVAVYL
jgi:hypothetical protein